MEALTEKQIAAGLARVRAIADCIREIGAVPSGHLYAQVCGRLTIAEYDKIIGILKHAGMVTESSSHMLTWVAA
jgi:hypothetical protein